MYKISRTIIISAILAAVLFPVASQAQSNDQAAPPASKATQSFIQSATIGNQFEISSSRLALQNSSNDDIHKFAQQMIDDHTKALNDLKTTLASEHQKPPEPAVSLDADHQAKIDKLNQLSGDAFDKEYLKDQTGAHRDAAKLFKDYAGSGDDQYLKSYAARTLPVILQHKKHLKAIRASYSAK